ncbi:unnamed protein product [Pieris macdunnoughi]|uniref:Uncharacterized protein n=1 Tax=Pieris macdunnoughi TaxID=345717 RepID=A0A821QIW0_9NEOP|nr:unnamed protein product [Pieris macdunnoughi]
MLLPLSPSPACCFFLLTKFNVFNSQSITDRLCSLSLRRNIAPLCVFYKVYYAECSEELIELIYLASFDHGTSRINFRFHLHYLMAGSLLRPGSLGILHFFASDLWHGLPVEVFPGRYDLHLCKKRDLPLKAVKMGVMDYDCT